MENTNQASCPNCGSIQIQIVGEQSGGFNKTSGICSGILGTICLGPIGLLCALFGIKDKTTTFSRVCLNCGNRF